MSINFCNVAFKQFLIFKISTNRKTEKFKSNNKSKEKLAKVWPQAGSNRRPWRNCANCISTTL